MALELLRGARLVACHLNMPFELMLAKAKLALCQSHLKSDHPHSECLSYSEWGGHTSYKSLSHSAVEATEDPMSSPDWEKEYLQRRHESTPQPRGKNTV